MENTEAKYTPSYIFMTDPKDRNNTVEVYFDTLIVRNEGTTYIYAAFGDGAHVNCVAASGTIFRNVGLQVRNTAKHVGEIERYVNLSDAVIAVRGGKVVYERGTIA